MRHVQCMFLGTQSACERCMHTHVHMSSVAMYVQLPIAAVRFIAVSATIRNINDLAEWLHVPPQARSTHTHCLVSFSSHSLSCMRPA